MNKKLNEGFGAVYHHYYAMPATGVSSQRPWNDKDYKEYYQEGNEGHVSNDDLADLVGTDLAVKIMEILGEDGKEEK